MPCGECMRICGGWWHGEEEEGIERQCLVQSQREKVDT